MVTTSRSIGAPVVDRPGAEPSDPSGTTRVTMLARISGTRNGADWPPPGESIELPAIEAADLIRNYLAKPAPEPVERAVVDPEPSERAVVEQPPISPERSALDRGRTRVAAKGKK